MNLVVQITDVIERYEALRPELVLNGITALERANLEPFKATLLRIRDTVVSAHQAISDSHPCPY